MRYLFLLAFSLSISTLNAQSFLSIHSGVHFSGNQDQKFKQFNTKGHLVNKIVTDDIDSKIAPSYSISLNSYLKNNSGIRLEWINWEYQTTVDEDVFIPTNRIVEQDRTAIFLNYIHRFPMDKRIIGIKRNIYFYSGLGGGMVLSDIDPGGEQWRHGVQVFTGLQLEIAYNLFFDFESKYIITYDVDNIKYTMIIGW